MKLIRPVREPHKITSEYGWRNLNGAKNFHDGIDYINIHNDRSVLAIADGIVIFDFDKYDPAKKYQPKHSGGNMVIIQHTIDDIKYYVRYLHLNVNYVSTGQKIKQGNVIGTYSNAGFSFGAHLHFDMYNEHWEKINPVPIMIKGLKEAGLI